MRQDVFIETDNWMAFQESLSVVEDMQKGQPGLMVAFGQAGRGKTECCRTHAVRSGAVYLRVMEDWTPRAMLAALCREVDGEDPPRSVDGCKRRLISILDIERRTIIVDEADRLRGIGMIEHFRDLADETGVPVVLVGERSLYGRIQSRRRLWSRVVRTVEFAPVSEEDIMLFALKASGLTVAPGQANNLRHRCDGDFRLVVLDMLDLEAMARANSIDAVSDGMIEALPKDRKPKPSSVSERRHGR